MPNKTNAITGSGDVDAMQLMYDDAAMLLEKAKETGLDTAPGAWEQSRKQAAYHEAGHAIINAARGFTVTKLSIFKQLGDWGGWCSSPNPTSYLSIASDPVTDWYCAENTIAGLAGELVSRTYTHGSSVDEIVKTRQIAGLIADKVDKPFPKVMTAIINSAVHKISYNRDVFDGLARRLYRQRKVKGPELRHYLRQVELPTDSSVNEVTE